MKDYWRKWDMSYKKYSRIARRINAISIALLIPHGVFLFGDGYKKMGWDQESLFVSIALLVFVTLGGVVGMRASRILHRSIDLKLKRMMKETDRVFQKIEEEVSKR